MGVSITQPLTSAAEYAMIKERDDGRNGVTVCITYFGESHDLLARAVNSALDQTVSPLEVVIIDDGSINPEIPRGFVELVGSDVAATRCVHVTNRGLPAARNVALMLAKGHAFLPLDADDWIEPNYIELTLPLLNKGADVVFTGLQEHGPYRNKSYTPGFDRPYDHVTLDTLWSYNRYFYCSLIRTETLKEVGGYNSRMAGGWGVSGGYEDWDLWIDFKIRGKKFAAVDDVLFNYNTSNPDGMLVQAEKNREVLLQEMRRHHGR